MKILNTFFEDLKIKKISHISDIHIRTYKRHKEYSSVFKKLYTKLKEYPTDLIVLSGDIVHSKTEMSPELIQITSTFFKKLASINPLLIFPGNHDTNLNNLNRMDAITPIVNNLNIDNIIYLKESGLYKIGNIYFVNMSVFDNPEKYIKAKEIEELNPKLALYHGVINNAKNEFGIPLLNSKITDKFFIGYDIVIAGDIHKRQNIQEYEIEKMVIDKSEFKKYESLGWKIYE